MKRTVRTYCDLCPTYEVTDIKDTTSLNELRQKYKKYEEELNECQLSVEDRLEALATGKIIVWANGCKYNAESDEERFYQN